MSSRRAAHARRQQSVDIPKYPPQSAQAQQTLQNLQAPPISDYESDNQGYASDYPSVPPPVTRSNEEMNITVLKRINPEIAAILSIAPYAVIYEFNTIPEPGWTKSGIEGSLFICQLTPGVYNEDRYHVVVLNRRGLDNFEAELREADDGGVEIRDPYVIISAKEGHELKINGVFIFSEGSGTSTEQARNANADLMVKLSAAAGYSRKAAEEAASRAVEQHHDGHVQEAANSAPMQGRQISLQEMFGQHRKDDAGYSLRAHNHGMEGVQPHQMPPMNQPQYPPQTQQQNVLGDLFRRAGLTG